MCARNGRFPKDLSTTLTIALATSATAASAGAWEAVSLAASTNCGKVSKLRFRNSVCISGKTATERAYLGEFLTAVANARPRCIKRQMSLRCFVQTDQLIASPLENLS
jgi:hypothetical protein